MSIFPLMVVFHVLSRVNRRGHGQVPENFLAEFTLCFKFAIKEHMTELIAEEDRCEAIQGEAGK